jgi:hypothetical protein
MNKLVTIGDNAIVVVTAEIDALTLSTSAKYEAADASSQKLDRVSERERDSAIH